MSDVPQQPLPYEPTVNSGVSRRQFRWLLILLLLQTLMTAQSLYAPGVAEWCRSRWAAHRDAVARAATLRQRLATDGLVLARVEPADKVLWEEDPSRAAALLTQSGYSPISPQVNWSTGVTNSVPPIAAERPPGILFSCFAGSGVVLNDVVLFAHGRTPRGGGGERLVIVSFSGRLSFSSQTSAVFPEEDHDTTVAKTQVFLAESYPGPDADGEFFTDGSPSMELSLHPSSEPLEMPLHWKTSHSQTRPGTVRIDYSDQLRIFAGQPDPADPSHFTIHYELDDRPGDIDGWLTASGMVQLKPRTGTTVANRWYPHAKQLTGQ